MKTEEGARVDSRPEEAGSGVAAGMSAIIGTVVPSAMVPSYGLPQFAMPSTFSPHEAVAHMHVASSPRCGSQQQ